MVWDRVYTVHDYYDGPRLGIADVDSAPHIFEAEFNHSSDEYGDTYFVSPIDESLLALVLEDWEIRLRWVAAFKRAAVSAKSHPCLPQDRERHDALKTAIGDRLRADRAHAKHLKARFETSRGNGGTIMEWRTADA